MEVAFNKALSMGALNSRAAEQVASQVRNRAYVGVGLSSQC